MADALSLAASAAGMLSLGLQTAEYLYKFYEAYRERDKEIARVLKALFDLQQCLETISGLVNTHDQTTANGFIIRHIEESILHCADVICEMEGEASKFKKESAQTLKESMLSKGRRAAYPLRRSTLTKMGEDVDEIRHTLSLSLQALGLQGQQQAQHDLRDLKNLVIEAQAHDLAESLRLWLDAPDVSTDYNDAIARRHQSTCQWISQDPSFHAWLHGQNSFLWLHGFAGCGKSVLCSTVIQSVMQQSHGTTNAVVYFYFTFANVLKQDASAMLRSILLQLCEQVKESWPRVESLQKSYRRSIPSNEILLQTICHIIGLCGDVHMIIDAIDEIPETNARNSRLVVLDIIHSLRRHNIHGLHMLVTSRDVPDVRSSFAEHKDMQNTDWLSLSSEDIDNDIRDYVHYQVDHDRDLRRWKPEQCQRIKEHLIQGAQGNFRWVDCQLSPLKACPRSPAHLERSLRSLPRGLDATYERILCNIPDSYRNEARQLLSLLCFALQPLSVEELLDALAVDPDNCETYDQDARLASVDDLSLICPQLLHFSPRDSIIQCKRPRQDEDAERFRLFGDSDEGSDPNTFQPSEGGYSTVFVSIGHFSVQEYLMSERIKEAKCKSFALTTEIEHARISKTCMIYFSDPNLLRDQLDTELMHRHAFLRYSAECLISHYRLAGEAICHALIARLADILQNEELLYRWTCLNDQRWCLPEPGQASQSPYSQRTRLAYSHAPLCVAVELELCDVLDVLLARLSGFVRDQSSLDRYALSVAVYTKQERAVRSLLQKGASPNDAHPQKGRRVPLAVACDYGSIEIVRLLVDHGARLIDEDQCESLPIYNAVWNGHIDVVRLLLAEHVDIEAWGSPSLLYVLSSRGNIPIIEMFLERGINVSGICAGNYDTALQQASWKGYEQVVRMFLEHGAKDNFVEGLYGTALQIASFRNEMSIVQMLIEHGADINTKGGLFDTALRAASFMGNDDIVAELLDQGAEVNVQVEDHDTALGAACRGGNLDTVRLLLNRGADVNASSGVYPHVLCYAAVSGKEDIVKLMLDRGADIRAAGARALCLASKLGYLTIVELLLMSGVSANAQDEKYGCALFHAIRGRQLRVVHGLLKHGADPNINLLLIESVSKRKGRRRTAKGEAKAQQRQKAYEMIVHLLFLYGAAKPVKVIRSDSDMNVGQHRSRGRPKVRSMSETMDRTRSLSCCDGLEVHQYIA